MLFWNFFILQEICLDLSLWYSSRMTIKSGLNLIFILKWWSWWVIDEAFGVNTEALWGILRNTLAPNCFLKFLHSVTNFSSSVVYLSINRIQIFYSIFTYWLHPKFLIKKSKFCIRETIVTYLEFKYLLCKLWSQMGREQSNQW